jgi:hypothetical protein
MLQFNCRKCFKIFPESEMQESHNVPKYIFNGDKNKADKYGKRWLCKKCHDIYERIIPSIIIKSLDEQTKQKCIIDVHQFSINYFKEWDTKKRSNNGNTKTTTE